MESYTYLPFVFGHIFFILFPTLVSFKFSYFHISGASMPFLQNVTKMVLFFFLRGDIEYFIVTYIELFIYYYDYNNNFSYGLQNCLLFLFINIQCLIQVTLIYTHYVVLTFSPWLQVGVLAVSPAKLNAWIKIWWVIF